MKLLTPILFITMLWLVSCSGDTAKGIPDTVPDIQGEISTLKRAASKTKGNSVAVILVKAKAQDVETNVYSKASIKVDNNTHIEDQTGSILKLEQLREGQQVEVWLDGPVMEPEPTPVQVYAYAVRVTL